jgi:hypothetical protein
MTRAQLAALYERARAHDCPECGARAGIRCRIISRYTYDGSGKQRTKVDVKRKPCSERVTLAWRETLREGAAPAAPDTSDPRHISEILARYLEDLRKRQQRAA